MGEAFVLRRGNRFEATIEAIFPAGCTAVICENSKKSVILVAPADSLAAGSYTFTVPFADTWMVTATNGGNSKSKSVEITIKGQHESIAISFVLWLVQDGVDNTTVTGGWKGASLWQSNDVTGRVPDITFRSGEMEIKQSGGGGNNSGLAYANNPIDLNGYSRLSITSFSEQTNSSHAKLVVWKGTPNNKDGVANVSIAQDSVQTYTLDVSSLSGEHYIGVYLYKYGGGRILVKDGIKLE